MTKKEKIALLEKAYTVKKIGEEEKIIISEDNTKEEQEVIKNLQFKLNHEVGNGSFEMCYGIMDKACDIVGEISEEYTRMTENVFLDEINERANGSASVYNADRLALLNIWNEDEIAEVMGEYSCKMISEACAIWYDKQVELACIILKDWLMEDEV